MFIFNECGFEAGFGGSRYESWKVDHTRAQRHACFVRGAACRRADGCAFCDVLQVSEGEPTGVALKKIHDVSAATSDPEDVHFVVDELGGCRPQKCIEQGALGA